MKGNISAKARRILADREASGKLMSYVVRGKEGSIIVDGKKISVRTTPVFVARKKASQA